MSHVLLQLEADRLVPFKVALMGAASVMVGSDEGGWTELKPDTSITGMSLSASGTPVFSAKVVIPRSRHCHVRAITREEQSITVLTMDVAPQVQHIVVRRQEEQVPASPQVGHNLTLNVVVIFT